MYLWRVVCIKCNKNENKSILCQLLFSWNTTFTTDLAFSVKIYILYSCKKIHIERNHHIFKSKSPLCSTSLVTVPPSTILGHAKKNNKQTNKKKENLKNNIKKNIYRWASKRVIKTLIYKKVNLLPVLNNECRSGETKKKRKERKKFPILYENIPQVPTLLIIYIQPLTLHCINTLQLKHCRQVSLEKQKYDSNINKAEHGYNIGMHAVNKHPVNNILRLNKVFL